MKNPILKQIIDYSDEKSFCFGIVCAECGKIRKSPPVCFSKAGEIPQTESKKIIFKILYERERERALEKAVTEAAKEVSLPLRQVSSSSGQVSSLGQQSHKSSSASTAR